MAYYSAVKKEEKWIRVSEKEIKVRNKHIKMSKFF